MPARSRRSAAPRSWSREHGAQLRDFVLQTSDPLTQIVGCRGHDRRRRGRGLGLLCRDRLRYAVGAVVRAVACTVRALARTVAEQLGVALLLLTRSTLQARRQTALDQGGERRVHLREIDKRVNALATLLELAWSLGAA